MHAHDVDETAQESKPRRKRRTEQTHPWYKRYPRDFWDGTEDLTLEEDGAYNRLIDWMYERGGPLPNDDAKLAGRLRVHINKWRPIRKRLFALQKLFITRDGIFNHKVQEVLSERGCKGVSTPHPPPDSPPDLFDNVLIFPNARQQSQNQMQNNPTVTALRVTFDDSRIVLYGELRAFWVDMFNGDEKALDLALFQAAEHIKPNGLASLEVKVSSQLSKQVQWMRERAARDAVRKSYAPKASSRRSWNGRPSAKETFAKCYGVRVEDLE